MGIFLNVLVVILLASLELNFLPHIRVFNIVPLILPFYIITISYFRKGFEPFFLASLAGILFDFNSSYPFGTYLIFFLLITAVMKVIFPGEIKNLPFGHFMIMSVVVILTFYIFQSAYLLLSGTTLMWSSWPIFAAGIIINAIYAILVYIFSIWYFEKISDLEHKLARR